MHRLLVPAALLSLTAGAAMAGPADNARSVADAASGVAVKVEKAVRKGVKAAASGVERGAKVAGQTADKVARKAGLPASQPSHGRASDPSR